MSRLLVRRPSPLLADGELTHLDRVPVDPDLALAQWHGYVDAFRQRGWEIVEVDPADDQPDGVFVEDAVVVFDDFAVLCRAGASSRRGEAETIAEVVSALGLEHQPVAILLVIAAGKNGWSVSGFFSVSSALSSVLRGTPAAFCFASPS